jgi:hypothetical protein
VRWCDVVSVARIVADLGAMLLAREEQTAEAAMKRAHERAILLHAEKRARVRK